jgi:hypothetical protein
LLGLLAFCGLRRASKKLGSKVLLRFIAKVGFGRKPAVYPAGAESRLVDLALKSSKMV